MNTFLGKVIVEPGVLIRLEMSYAKRTGPQGSDVSRGLDIDQHLEVHVDPHTKGVRFNLRTVCVAFCQQNPRCPHPDLPHVYFPSR